MLHTPPARFEPWVGDTESGWALDQRGTSEWWHCGQRCRLPDALDKWGVQEHRAPGGESDSQGEIQHPSLLLYQL